MTSPIQLAATALREYLLATLPAKVVALNLTRAAVLKAGTAGPYTIPNVGIGDNTLKIATTREGPFIDVTITAGSRTATQMATQINQGVVGMVASVDFADRLIITSSTPPVAATNTLSCIAVGPSTTGINDALGWTASGEYILSAPIRCPTSKGVCDGNPLHPFDNGQGFWVVLDDRDCTPWPSPEMSRRRDEYQCVFQVNIYRPDTTTNPFRSREAITSCTRAVREVLTASAGAYLGRQSQGDVMLAEIISEKIGGTPFSFSNSGTPNLLFDVATLTIRVRVFQIPSA